MSKKRKKYLVTCNSEAYACSLVTSPAVEETFVAFAEDKPLIEKFSDEKKHMITGVVAIPGKPIYRRNEDGEEYDIVFSAEAIENMAKDFMKNYRQHEVTLQHQENADGVYLVEQWIKTDNIYDKSISVGLSRELPVGSWIQTYYVDSNDVWKRIEDGELLGFSLECMLGLEEFESQIELNSNNNMNIETNEMFWDKLKNILKETFSKKDGEIEPVNEIDLAKQSGFTNVEDYKKEVEAIKEELEEQNPAPTPEPTPEPVSEPSEPVSEPEPTVTPEPVKEEPTEPVNEPVEEPKNDNAHLEELINNLKSEIEALKGYNSELQNKVKDMEKQPSTQPVNVNAKPSAGDSYAAWREQLRGMIG